MSSKHQNNRRNRAITSCASRSAFDRRIPVTKLDLRHQREILHNPEAVVGGGDGDVVRRARSCAGALGSAKSSDDSSGDRGSVVLISGATSESTIFGFTIHSGFATAGAGILVDASRATIEQNGWHRGCRNRRRFGLREPAWKLDHRTSRHGLRGSDRGRRRFERLENVIFDNVEKFEQRRRTNRRRLGRSSAHRERSSLSLTHDRHAPARYNLAQRSNR